MATIKGFSFSFLMFCCINLQAMEFFGVIKDDTVQTIWDKIDREHVGVSNCVMNLHWHLRSAVGSLLSICKGRLMMTPERAKKEMNAIESYISSNDDVDKKDVLQKLIAQHWYVNYLIQALACNTFNELEYVTGETIDTVYNDVDEKISQRLARFKAYNMFFNKSQDWKLIDIIPQVISDIHFTVLYHSHGDVQPDSLKMSSDGKYLQATTTDKLNITQVWEMQTGKTVNELDINVEQWNRGMTYADHSHYEQAALGGYSCSPIERYRVCDKEDNYCAMVAHPYMSIDSEFFPKDVVHNSKAIILFKRPKEVSYLGQKAFDNSYTKIDELKALENSKIINDIQGFPKENLKRVIENRITELTK